MQRYVAVVRSSDVSRYEVSIPDFQDCTVVEDSLEKAIRSAGGVLRARIIEMLRRGEAVPRPRGIEEIRSEGPWRSAIADGILASVLVPGHAFEASTPRPAAMAG